MHGSTSRLAEQAFARGNVYFTRHEYADAVSAYQDAIKLKPNYAEAYSNLSYAYFRQRRYDDAEKAANRALELYPSLPSAMTRLAHVYSARGKYSEAIRLYQRASSIDSKYAEAHNGLGATYLDLKRYDQAISEAERAARLSPRWPNPHLMLGLVYWELKRYDEAILEYQRAISLDARWSNPHNNLGLVYRDLRRYGEAIAEYQKAIDLDPEDAVAHNNLGDIYFFYRQGPTAAAIKEYKEAARLMPNRAWYHFNLGAAYNQDGRQDEAKAELQKYLELAPKRLNQGIGMIWVPSGTFIMGSTDAEAQAAFDDAKRYKNDAKLEWFTDAKPRHRVTIRDGFWMGRYEITQAQWKSIMGTTVRQQRDKLNPSFPLKGEGDTYPIYYVSWNEVKEFIQKLNQMNDGFTYRLPTEAEWEYAVRAGTTGTFSWGEDVSRVCQFGNVSDQTAKEKYTNWTIVNCRDGYAEISPVGTFPPNALGLYDMTGNLGEWCEDPYQTGYVAAPTDGSASQANSKLRVWRGGSWASLAYQLRSAYRLGVEPDVRYSDLGFRVVAVPRLQ